MIVVMKSVVSKVLNAYRASWHFMWALGAVPESLKWIYVYSLCKKYYCKNLITETQHGVGSVRWLQQTHYHRHLKEICPKID